MNRVNLALSITILILLNASSLVNCMEENQSEHYSPKSPEFSPLSSVDKDNHDNSSSRKRSRRSPSPQSPVLQMQRHKKNKIVLTLPPEAHVDSFTSDTPEGYLEIEITLKGKGDSKKSLFIKKYRN